MAEKKLENPLKKIKRMELYNPKASAMKYLCVLWMVVCLIYLPGNEADDSMHNSENGVKSDSGVGNENLFSCTKADLNTAVDGAVEIDLSMLDTDYIITEAGDYLLSGDYCGQIMIDAEEQIVHLILNNVDIYSLSGSAIHVKSAGKVIITLMEGSDNTIRDSAHYRNKNDGDAALYSNCDLTINGSGILSIYGFYNDAVRSKDIVKILGGEIFIQAMGNGIRGSDGILINTLSLTIESKKNGLYSTKRTKNGKGTIDVSGGELSIIAGEYAVSSANDLYVRNCLVWSNSVLGDFSTAGREYLMEGCVKNE